MVCQFLGRYRLGPLQQAAAVGLEKFNNDPVLQFFKAYGVLREGEDPSVLPPDLRH